MRATMTMTLWCSGRSDRGASPDASLASYANACRYDTVLGWLERLCEEILSGGARLLLVKAWVLSFAARREESRRA